MNYICMINNSALPWLLYARKPTVKVFFPLSQSHLLRRSERWDREVCRKLTRIKVEKNREDATATSDQCVENRAAVSLKGSLREN